MKRFIFIATCLFIGLAFTLSLWFMPSSPEMNPDWLAVLGLAYYIITPIVWFCCGLIVSRATVTRSQKFYALFSVSAASIAVLAVFYIYSHQ
ncbi:hypothetical protein [Geobacter sp.]|uniref:hypothetical protein n=1 Tax=Geobacter sp. TaxID=46610 RepID=UPI002610D2F5|nr:hypothetical protein [Geobacter sp.]